jgi:MoaA/NifB/PqqE/SkfB family radical SAM enzyme
MRKIEALMRSSDTIESLPILILYPHSRCNCRCVMCDIWKEDAIQEISQADLERHIADIESLRVQWVIFSGGEPLMHSDLFRVSDSLRACGIRTTALSTGILLSKYARRIAISLDDVIVSLDGPPPVHDGIRRVGRAFELLAAGVRTLHRESPDFSVAARCTVQKQNVAHLRETVRAAKYLGLRSISFLAADVTSTAFNRPQGWSEERQSEVALSAAEIDVLEHEIEELIRELPDDGGFVLESPLKLRRILHHFKAHLGLVEPVSPRCNAPWVSAVMEADGTVRPCFFHRPIGSVREDSLRGVLNSPAAIAFRQSLDVAANPVCRRCVCSLYLAGDSKGNCR